MSKIITINSLRTFFKEVFDILKRSKAKVVEIWIEPDKINFFSSFNEYKIDEFLETLNSISLIKGNYTKYICVNKILFIVEAIRILDIDIRDFSLLLDFDGFEALAAEILKLNEFKTLKNYRFMDVSNDLNANTGQKRYEIDVIGFYRNKLLLIDAKQWKKKDSFSAMNKAGNLQYQRAIALKKNPDKILELLSNLEVKKIPKSLTLIPFMVSLEQNFYRLNHNSIPLVSIYELNSFLAELTFNMKQFRIIKVEEWNH